MTDAPTFSDTTEMVTVECATCGAQITGTLRGRGTSANFLLARHKWGAHKERSSSPARATRRVSGPSDAEVIERPILAEVRDIASGVGGRGTPSESQLKKAFGKGLGMVTIAVASAAAESDPNIPDGPQGEQAREELTDYLSLSPSAGEEIMGPIAKAFAPTKLNRKYGRTMVENVDVVSAVAELVTLGQHWRQYFRTRSYTKKANQARQTFGPERVDLSEHSGPIVPVAPSNGAMPEGTVLTPEMVQHMRSQS